MDESHREIETALHSARVPPHLAICGMGQTDPREQLVGTLVALVARKRLQRRLEPEMLAPGQQRVECRLLQRRTDGGSDLRPFRDDVVAGHAGRPRRRRQQRRQHVDGRRLARSVRPQEAVDLAGLDTEIDSVDGANIPRGSA